MAILCNSKARQVQPILIKQLFQESTLKTTFPWGSFTRASFDACICWGRFWCRYLKNQFSTADAYIKCSSCESSLICQTLRWSFACLSYLLKVSQYDWPPVYFVWMGCFCLPMLNEQQFYLFGQIQTSQTGGQPYSNTSPYGECSLSNLRRDRSLW